MEKVRLAIVGKNNSNLKDLDQLDGNDDKRIVLCTILGLCTSAIIPHRVPALISARVG